jgi:hypothetical protein
MTGCYDCSRGSGLFGQAVETDTGGEASDFRRDVCLGSVDRASGLVSAGKLEQFPAEPGQSVVVQFVGKKHGVVYGVDSHDHFYDEPVHLVPT